MRSETVITPESTRNVPEQWEYKVIHFSADRWTPTGLPSDINEKFDAYGAEGWELVATESIVRPNWFWQAGTTVGIVGFFKRPLRR